MRKDDPISQRVMYDDVKKAFWNRRLVRSLLPDVSDSQQRVITAYAHLRTNILGTREAGEKATHAALKKYFIKTYQEKISWWHLFATYAAPRSCAAPRRATRRVAALLAALPGLAASPPRRLPASPASPPRRLLASRLAASSLLASSIHLLRRLSAAGTTGYTSSIWWAST